MELVPVKFDEMLARIAANKKAKLTLVDAWATWCGPCKENFPHVVEMHEKYAGKGLAVVSLSLDDRDEAQAGRRGPGVPQGEEGRLHQLLARRRLRASDSRSWT